MARILNVDDEEMITAILRRLLESDGHTVETALDGGTAFNLVRARDYDLVISDIRMDPMDGMELLRLIRLAKPDLPVIMLTAYASEETMKEAEALGAAAYLTKPFTGKEVLGTVQRVLAAQAARARPPTADQVVREYMERAKLPGVCEAQVELADELYWLGEQHPKERLLLALNEALGRSDVSLAVMDEILAFRETAIRVKQMVAQYAAAEGLDPAGAASLLEVARKISAARKRNAGDAAKTMAYAARLLKLPPDTLTPADLQFFEDFHNLRKPAAEKKKTPADPAPPPSSAEASTIVTPPAGPRPDGMRLKQS